MSASKIFIYPGFIFLNLLFAETSSTVLAEHEIICWSSLFPSYGMIFEMRIFSIFPRISGENNFKWRENFAEHLGAKWEKFDKRHLADMQ